MKFASLDLIRKLGVVYALMFFLIASLAYIPGVADADGNLFGLFQLDLYDDLLHFFSGVWAAWAAWRSREEAIRYFKIFGIVYGLDGVMGLLLGQGYLDGGIFFYGVTLYQFQIRFFANLPHLLIGGIAVFIGFVVSKRYAAARATAA